MLGLIAKKGDGKMTVGVGGGGGYGWKMSFLLKKKEGNVIRKRIWDLVANGE